MDETETTLARVKNFVNRHRVGIAVTTTAAICLVLNRVALKQHDEFLAEKGLLDEFYTPNEDE